MERYGEVDHKTSHDTNGNNYSSRPPTLGSEGLVLALGRDENGMAFDQDFALASLDPSVRVMPMKHKDVGQAV